MPVLRAHGLRADGYSVWSGEYELGVIVPIYSTVSDDAWLWSMTNAMIASGTEDGLDAAKAAFANSWRRSINQLGMEEGEASFEDLSAGRLTMRPREGYPPPEPPRLGMQEQYEVLLRDRCVGCVTRWLLYGRDPFWGWQCADHPEHRGGIVTTLEAGLVACDAAWRRWMVLAGLRYVPRLELT